ncbi:hypothetical protein IHE44_0015019 [Lamprotornis superbus]|uniref:E3 ubiquitin-protein ligase RNF220 middle domain-containing protein n=1 Tax=Lamprotornis superbus TaxID=245042 RepID=A0A835TVD3_9PASS|nr:hypothetical protein IHE44_0015019 [Lamprotornis superbus]
MGKKKATLFDSQAPICPICQVLLRPGELQEHMEQELEKLTQLNIRVKLKLQARSRGWLVRSGDGKVAFNGKGEETLNHKA